MSVVGKTYLDPGDRLSGWFDPPRRCTVLAGWGPVQVPPEYGWLHLKTKQTKSGKVGGPRNVLVEYEDDGSRAVIPFSRRLLRDQVKTQTVRMDSPESAAVTLRRHMPLDACRALAMLLLDEDEPLRWWSP